MKKQISIYIDEEMLMKIDAAAKKSEGSRAQQIRLALKKVFESNGKSIVWTGEERNNE